MIDRRGLIGGGVTLATMAGLVGRARAAGAPVVNRIRLEDDRVWIAAKIRDTGPHLFVIDTGGSLSIINEKFADKIGMKVINRRVTGGCQRQSPVRLVRCWNSNAGEWRQLSAHALYRHAPLRHKGHGYLWGRHVQYL